MRPLQINISLLGTLFALLSFDVSARQVTNLSHPGTGPYSTIQAAIDNAATATGDTLHISAGTFPENVTVSKSIYLWGQGTTTIIAPPSGKGIVISVDTVSFHDLKVANALSHGIVSTGTRKSVSLVNVTCDRDSVGAQLNNINGLTITGCVFSHNQYYGLYVYPSSNVVVGNTSAIGNGTSGTIGTSGTGSGFVFGSLAGTSTLTNLIADSNKSHGMAIGGNSKNVTASGGEFKYNGSSNPSDGGGIYVYARSSTVSNVIINGPLNASNNITAGIYVDANTSPQDSIKGLTIGQSGGTVTLASNGGSRGTGMLVWGNISNATITANFSQGNVSTSAGVVILGRDGSGANSPTNITIANSTFNAGYTSSTPAITLADAQPTPSYIDVNGVTATDNIWPAGSNIDLLIYDHSDNTSLGVVTHTGDIILPVELVSFNAHASENAVTLVWSTATEVNNYGFEVQRSLVRSEQLVVKNQQSAFLNPQSAIVNWQVVGFIHGVGTSSSPRSYSFIDPSVLDGEYLYRLRQIDRDGTFSFSNQVDVAVGSTGSPPSLSQNYPNPFNPLTSVEFTVPTSGKATISVYNILGQTVSILFDGVAQAGERYRLQFDASGFPSGLYFYRLQSGQTRIVKRMIVLK